MMDMIKLIDEYRGKLNKDPYSCLLFALQLPSICSRIEYPPESLSENECLQQMRNSLFFFIEFVKII